MYGVPDPPSSPGGAGQNDCKLHIPQATQALLLLHVPVTVTMERQCLQLQEDWLSYIAGQSPMSFTLSELINKVVAVN